jgi:uncharacterized paraquat-inducible protein A
MNDKQIENLLKECRFPEPPTGMRERVLHRAGRELTHSRPRLLTWKSALVCAGVLIILVSNCMNFACEKKLAAMTGSGNSSISTTVSKSNLLANRREMERLLADAGVLAPSAAMLRKGGIL